MQKKQLEPNSDGNIEVMMTMMLTTMMLTTMMLPTMMMVMMMMLTASWWK
jgi:hypothetical protein